MKCFLKRTIAKRGFTLFELMLAAALAGVLGLGVFRVFSSGLDVYQWFAENRLYFEAATFYEEIALDLRNLSLLQDGYFEGAPDRMSFLVHEDPLDGGIFAESIIRVEYLFSEGDIIKNTYYFASDRKKDTKIVLSDVQHLEFSYASREEQEENEVVFFPQYWQVPVSVKISFRMEDKEETLVHFVAVPLKSIT